MATFKVCIFRHQKRKDGKYPVSIRVCHNRKYSYIPTGFNVTADQINKRNFEVKDTAILRECHDRIAAMEKIVAEHLGFRKAEFDAKGLADYLVDRLAVGTDVDFVEYSERLSGRLDKEGRTTTANTYRRTTRALIDFCNGRRRIAFSEINVSFLTKFVDYLKTPRTLKRVNRPGVKTVIHSESLNDTSIAGYLATIRIIYNQARREYNTETDVVIKGYPFAIVKVKPGPPKRRSLSPEEIKKILAFNDYCLAEDPADVPEHLKRALSAFCASFYLCGVNMADLFTLRPPKAGKVAYNRHKTQRRRTDDAYQEIAIPEEAKPIFDRYRDPKGEFAFIFNRCYSNNHGFVTYTNTALKKIAAILDVDPNLSSYYARHTWATIARNKAGVSRDDIDLALNHVDLSLKMADVYIEKDFSMIDAANRKVIDYLKTLPDPVINHSAETSKS